MDKNEPKEITEILNDIKDLQKRKDCLTILELLKGISNEEPKLWNGNMIGFGRYKYKYESGQEGEWFLTGFSARKRGIVVYLIGDVNHKKTVFKGFWQL